MLTITKFTLISMLAASALPAAPFAGLLAQQATVQRDEPKQVEPSFELATIKPSDTSAPHGTGIRADGSHIAAFNFTIGELIGYAYGLQAKQIITNALIVTGW